MKTEFSDIIAPIDVPAAIGLLTRLPVPVDGEKASARGGKAAWAWPIAGGLVGLIAGCVALIALMLGLPTEIAALLALGVQAILTGAMHEDGLMDCCDGFWGGWTPDKRLEIMKDSHLGAYAALGLVITVLLRWQALAFALLYLHPISFLIAIAVASRVPMVVLMALMPNARGGGLSSSVGAPPRLAMWIAIVLGLGAVFLTSGFLILPITLGAVAMGAATAALAKWKIGGQTGDVLGASQQMAELGALIAVVIAFT